MPLIRDRIEQVREKIANKLAALGRDDATIVAVTKTHPVESVEEALRAGIAHIGENKVQEALRKIPMLREPYDGFHFIGHLQSNKINNLLTLKPALIQSVDSLYIAQKLNASLGRKNQIAALPCLRVKGLMTIGLMSIDAEKTRPYFTMLRELFERFGKLEIPGVEMRYLSMGMSDDYLVALEEGSNMLRLGSALFGARDYGARK